MGSLLDLCLKWCWWYKSVFCYCWTAIPQSPFLLLTPPQRRLEVHKNLRPQQLAPLDQKNIPYHIVSCWTYEAKGRGGSRDIHSDGAVFPSSHFLWWSPAFTGMAEDLPACGKQWINSLFCFACTCKLLLYIFWTCLSLPTNFLTFTLLIFLPISLCKGVDEWLGGV